MKRGSQIIVFVRHTSLHASRYNSLEAYISNISLASRFNSSDSSFIHLHTKPVITNQFFQSLITLDKMPYCIKFCGQQAVVGKLCQNCFNATVTNNNISKVPAQNSLTTALSKQNDVLMRAKILLSSQSLQPAAVCHNGTPSRSNTNTPEIEVMNAPAEDPYDIARLKRTSAAPYPSGTSKNPELHQQAKVLFLHRTLPRRSLYNVVSWESKLLQHPSRSITPQLGTKRAGVNNQVSFLLHLENNKYIDLIFNHDAYSRKKEKSDSEEVPELKPIESTLSCKSNRNNEPSTCPPEYPTRTTSDSEPSEKIHGTDSQIIDLSGSVLIDHPDTPIQLFSDQFQYLPFQNQTSRGTPPWVMNQIINPSDLSWDRFGTDSLSSLFSNHDAVGWIEGIRLELDPNGIDTFRRLVHYQINNDQVLSESQKGRVVKAQLLNTPEIHSMAAKCILFRDPQTNSFLPLPIYRMRTYTLARQFMCLFCHSVSLSRTAASDLKSVARTLRIVQAFPVYPDPQIPGNQFDDFGEPEREEELRAFDEEPRKLFFMEEYIGGKWEEFLDPSFFDTDVNDNSPAISQLMAAFQHWTYNHTKGQMIVTNLKGVIPVLSKPKIVDLNPRAHWSRFSQIDPISYIHKFLREHACSRACRDLNLGSLKELKWPQVTINLE
ncbi:hypothetical protein PSTG_13664 [Puccinia striiformis f. sp. tritici PST-78]|uniref:Alpha-type protein kinase domain-containing protein n=1 Tax=Puccinia striiformis f. sp. tritici PST-78 TaxID=1165861 RepID=A0A0L0V100_9BASI|nr:hypothetical protein PSTG_13664 [Puccinia striiformis f. sp. tritici PST-78]